MIDQCRGEPDMTGEPPPAVAVPWAGPGAGLADGGHSARRGNGQRGRRKRRRLPRGASNGCTEPGTAILTIANRLAIARKQTVSSCWSEAELSSKVRHHK